MRRFAALAAFALACSGTAAPRAPAPDAPREPAAAEPDAAEAGATEAPPPRVPGVPHLTNIERVVLSPSGDAAITGDRSGRLRFWASLDGEVEPQPIPLASARHLALARGPELDGRRTWTIALIDSAGGGHLLRALPDGAIKRLADVSPGRDMIDAQVLAGGRRALFLRADRAIELRDASGEILATHDRRGFRPAQIRAGAGDTFVALEISPGSSESEVTAHRMRIVERRDKVAIEAVGDDYAVSVNKLITTERHHSSISPSARRFAFLVLEPKKRKWSAVLVDLEERSHRSLDLSLLQNQQALALGFVGESTLIARGGTNGSTWRIDLTDGGETMEPLPARPSFTAGQPQAFASSVMVAGMGSWLYVYRLQSRESLYLGYEAFVPMAAAVSPSGELAAHSSGNQLFIAAASGRPISDHELEKGQSIRYLSFIDEGRILVAYYTAAVEIYDWKAKKTLARVTGPGAFQAGGYDPASKLFYTIPRSGQVWVTEVSGQTLRGPYVVADGAARAGFLDGARLWTFDGKKRLRHYSIEELRDGVSRADIERGAVITANAVGVGRDGRIYATTYANGRTQLSRYPAPEIPGPGPGLDSTSVKLESAHAATIARAPTLVEVSPAGDQLAMVVNNVIFVRDTGKLEAAWSYPFPNGVRSVGWNASGTHLAVATREGAVIFDAATGKPASASCGPRFAARTVPPTSVHPSNVATSVCERR